MKVVVTGASGKAGRSVVRGLLERDHDVLSVDLVPPQEQLSPFLRVDLTELGQTVECLAATGSVVHLAAIPASGIATEETTFTSGSPRSGTTHAYAGGTCGATSTRVTLRRAARSRSSVT